LVNQIELLVNLQTVDQQLRERSEAIESHRRQIAELESELAEQRKVLDGCRAERAELEARRREIEGALADEEAKMKDRRMRLNRIRNEKEAAAVRREIEVGKEGNQKLEEDLMVIFEALDGVGARETELQSAFDALAAQRDERQAVADVEIGTLSEGLDDSRKRREELAAGIDANLRRQYETVFVRRRGVAVVEVRSGNCQGCHMRVSPQLTNEIQRNQRVIACPNCSRILYVRNESAVTQA
jgi:predicted  nucleic acid-binding Zn-ribbon protein